MYHTVPILFSQERQGKNIGQDTISSLLKHVTNYTIPSLNTSSHFTTPNTVIKFVDWARRVL